MHKVGKVAFIKWFFLSNHSKLSEEQAFVEFDVLGNDMLNVKCFQLDGALLREFLI